MATTYLELSNEILRELNEIPLTSSNFATATGFQQFVNCLLYTSDAADE